MLGYKTGKRTEAAAVSAGEEHRSVLVRVLKPESQFFADSMMVLNLVEAVPIIASY